MAFRDRRPHVHSSQRSQNANMNGHGLFDETRNSEEHLVLFTNTLFFDSYTGRRTDFSAHPVDIGGNTPLITGDNEAILPNHTDSNLFNTRPPTPSNGFADGAHMFHFVQPDVADCQRDCWPEHFGLLDHDFQVVQRLSNRNSKLENIPEVDYPPALEDASRRAAEEDRRKRNTAASARFRIKKKQREEALQKSFADMSREITALESKALRLEIENKSLQKLLVESDQDNDETVVLWKEFITSKTSGRSGPGIRLQASIKGKPEAA